MLEEDFREQPIYYVPITIVILVCFALIVAVSYRVTLIPERMEEELPQVVAEPIPAKIEPIEIVEEEVVIETKADPFMTDRDLIAAVVMAESGSEKFIGKVAVAAVVLNRAEMFDSSIEGIVTAENQFSYPYYGVITKACYEAVDYAMENRDLFPKNMIYFRNQHFHDIGENYIQIGNHFFSTAGAPEYEIESLGEKD